MGKFDINSDSSDPFAIQLNQFSNLLSTTSAKQISSHIVSNGIICTRDVKGAALHVSHRMTSTSSCLVTSNHRDSTTQLVSHKRKGNSSMIHRLFRGKVDVSSLNFPADSSELNLKNSQL